MAKAKTPPTAQPPGTKTLNAKRLESENRKLRQKNEGLKHRKRELELISQSFLSINSSLELDRVLSTILEAIRNLFGVVGSSIWLKDQKTGEVVCRQAAGFQQNIVKGWRLSPGEGIAGWVSSYGESVVLPDTREDTRHFRKVADKMQVELRSIISVPMRVKGTVIGALQMVDKKVGRFNESHGTLLEALADASATAIENAQLFERANREIAERKRAEKKLKNNEKELKDKSVALKEVNTALNVLLKNREEDQGHMEDIIVANVKDLVLPFLEKLGQSQLDEKQATYVDIIQANISNIVSPFLRQIPMKFFDLTPTEIQIADLVRKDKTTKEIAQILNASAKTIEAHRNRLRKKLGLTNQRIQLRDYLMTLV
ncbi:MAG: GAF domain-containing protein [Desulfosarcina sp.]|nr:GAF domain-containing protein [Desulfosarcina sp.]MBC2742289.1 GAF domain-containing protein [Desulfosarcina sp.]MBC2765200.1 GAF domain-containing protein [Desulfosarcina sp.]